MIPEQEGVASGCSSSGDSRTPVVPFKSLLSLGFMEGYTPGLPASCLALLLFLLAWAIALIGIFSEFENLVLEKH